MRWTVVEIEADRLFGFPGGRMYAVVDSTGGAEPAADGYCICVTWDANAAIGIKNALNTCGS